MMPPLSFSAFFAAALDFLLANQLAFWLVVLTACILAYECWLHAVKDAALRRVDRDRKKREAIIKAQREMMLRVIAQAKGVDNPNRFR